MTPTTAPTMAPTASPTSPVPEALVCYSSETTTLASTEDAFWDMRSIDGALDFGVISVPAAGGDVMLDINASTGGVIDRGNDLDGKKMSYAFYSGYFVGLGVSLRPGCTTSIGCTSSSIYPVPNAFLTLNGVQDVRDFHQEAFETGDGGFRDNQLMEKMVSARFFVPDLPPGDYLIQINVSLGVTTGIGSFDDDQGWFTDTEVVLGPHIIVAQVLQATNRVCDPSMYLESMGM
jgi:hypothetical protein